MVMVVLLVSTFSLFLVAHNKIVMGVASSSLYKDKTGWEGGKENKTVCLDETVTLSKT